MQPLLEAWVPGVALPTEGDVKVLTASPDGFGGPLPLDEVLQDFSNGAAAIDRQAAAQMTVGALSLTVLGLVDDVDQLALIPVAVSALIGVVLAQFALLIFVGRTPGTSGTIECALTARTLFLRKFGFVTVSQFFIALAITGAAGIMVFST